MTSNTPQGKGKSIKHCIKIKGKEVFFFLFVCLFLMP